MQIKIFRNPIFKLTALVILLGMLVQSGCAAGKAEFAQNTAKPAEFAGLPGLSDLRAASDTDAPVQTGSQAWMKSAGTSVNGDNLEFGTLAGATAEWSIHCFSLADPLLSASFNLVAPNEGIYLAVANYSSGRWEVSGPWSGSHVLALNNNSHNSPSNKLFLAVIATEPDSILQSINVTTEGEFTAQYFDETLGIDMGEYIDMEVVNGNPALVCFDATNFKLLYCRANDVNGASWGTVIYADTAQFSGYHPSLSVINNQPAIAYERYSGTNLDLMYVRASDANGASWGSPKTLVAAGGNGYQPVLRNVAGQPAVAYHSTTQAAILLMRANDAQGDSWGSAVTVSSDAELSTLDMQIVNEIPMICWFGSGKESLQCSRATDATGSAWAASSIIDAAVDTGYDVSLAVVDGQPAVAYTAAEVGELRYCRSSDANGNSWGSPQLLDSGVETGPFCSLAYIGGLPQVCYFHGDFIDELKFVRAQDASGASWDSPIVLDVGSGYGISLTEVNGQSAVAYFAVSKLLVGYQRGF